MMIYGEKRSSGYIILEYSLTLLINAFVLMLASRIFTDFDIASFGYAFLTALVIMLLNKTIKPFIKILTLPLTIVTLGMFYPFINVIILKLASWIIGESFYVGNIFIAFIVAIFISMMTIILDALITKRIMRGIK